MGILQDDIAGDVGAVPRCQYCGSERIVRDAWACWNSDSGLWELEAIRDRAYCHQCGDVTKLVWSRPDTPDRRRIRELNDRFRRDGQGRGSIILTIGIRELGREFALRALEAVRAFDAFTGDNDPWGEHDFGAIEVEDEKVFFKID